MMCNHITCQGTNIQLFFGNVQLGKKWGDPPNKTPCIVKPVRVPSEAQTYDTESAMDYVDSLWKRHELDTG